MGANDTKVLVVPAWFADTLRDLITAEWLPDEQTAARRAEANAMEDPQWAAYNLAKKKEHDETAAAYEGILAQIARPLVDLRDCGVEIRSEVHSYGIECNCGGSSFNEPGEGGCDGTCTRGTLLLLSDKLKQAQQGKRWEPKPQPDPFDASI